MSVGFRQKASGAKINQKGHVSAQLCHLRAPVGQDSSASAGKQIQCNEAAWD